MSIANRLYLASKSPRRKALLSSIGFEPVVLADPVEPRGWFAGDEERQAGELPAAYAERTACEKFAKGLAAAREVEKTSGDALLARPVLAADTVVSLDGEVLGKPKDAEEAVAFLRALSGRVHEVRTTVVVGRSARDRRFLTNLSLVSFCSLSEDDIAAYVATGEPFDKAGGYGIQGLAGIFIDRIEGSYTGIMGLPIFEAAQLLKAYGVVPESACLTPSEPRRIGP